MRISRRNFRLCYLFGAVLLASPWGPCQAQSVTPPPIPGQNPNGMHVYVRADLTTHGQREHDYPRFVADWSKRLTEYGAIIDGSLCERTRAAQCKEPATAVNASCPAL